MDDEIHAHLLEIFPEFKFDEALRDIDEESMKSAKGKERWRSFIMPVSTVCPSITETKQPNIVREQVEGLQFWNIGAQGSEQVVWGGQLCSSDSSSILRY